MLVAPLALTGCPGDDSGDTGAVGSTGAETPATTEDPVATGATSSDDETAGEETEAPAPGNCQEEQEIPAAPVDCSGATGTLEGSAIIEDGGDDPSILDGIGTVTGSIQVNRAAVTDLNFMACVQSVGGEVTIFGNEQLTDVSGLHSLTEIGTDFIFSENSAVMEFNGLPLIQQVGNNVIMKNNDNLGRITGFHSLVGINGNLTIQSNPVLNNIDGLGGLRVVGGILAITANPELCISSVDCVGEGIVMPAVPPDSWSTQANNNEC